eukprot:194365_1
MATLEGLTKKLDNPTLESLGHLLVGGSSGAIALTILYPLEQLNTRSTVGKGSTARILTWSRIVNDFRFFRIDNIFDLYRGLQFGKGDWKRRHTGEMPLPIALFRGSLAGMCTQIFTLPLGTIQKVLQTTGKEDPNHSNASMMEMSMLLTINPAINMYIHEWIRIGYMTSASGIYGIPHEGY